MTETRALAYVSSPEDVSLEMALNTTRKWSGCVGLYVFPLCVLASEGFVHCRGGSIGRKGMAAGMMLEGYRGGGIKIRDVQRNDRLLWMAESRQGNEET